MSIFRINSMCSRYVANSFILNTLDTQTNNYIRFLNRKSSKTSLTSDKLNQRTFFTSAYFCEKEVTVDVTPVKAKKKDKFEENQIKKRKSRMNMGKYLERVVQPEAIGIWTGITIKQLGEQSNKKTDDILEIMFGMDHLSKYIRDTRFAILDMKDLVYIAKRLGLKVKFISNPNNVKNEVFVDKDARRRPLPSSEKLVSRPPVVTIMGHIDHGKTSLLDYLRKSQIVAGEHGGITQHIGAFTVKLESGHAVTFIDTPGHAAFTGMRSRGANITDIVILIVDSCEGVLDQTRESLRMIRQARAPFIVALNKIDKPGSDVEMVKEQLEEEGVLLEDKGGDVQCVPISALKGTNVNKLVEEVQALAEILELKCDKTGLAEGTIIESQIEKGLGRTATVLLQRGSLKPSQFIVGEKFMCKVRLLLDDRGNGLKELFPSQAAKVVGWKDQAPSAGAEILGVENESRAKEVVLWRKNKEMQDLAESQLDTIEEQRKEQKEKHLDFRKLKMEKGVYKARMGTDWNPRVKESAAPSDDPKVSVIIKGDVDGSVEAILDCLDSYSCPEVELDIVSFGVGEVNESDVVMAEKFGAIIYAFNTTAQTNVQKEADTKNISIRMYNVIYHLIHDLKNEINDEMPEMEVEDIVGRATVLQEFLVTIDKKKVAVAGSKVIQGKISRSSNVRVERDRQIIFDGSLSMLKHFKDEVEEVKNGQECGLKVADESIHFETGDQIICYSTRQQRDKTSWDPGF